jgi:mRNA turnover protein 4
MGKTTIMSKALGTTPETAHAEASHLLSKYLSNPSSPLDTHGLLFTNREPQNLLSYTRNFSATDFARAGTASNRDFIIPAGQVYSTAGEIAREDDVPLVHSMEPELRGLGVPTRLEKGKITLENEYVVCREGQVLDSRQTRLLKMFGVAMAEFRVRVVAYWSSETHEVTEVDDEEDEE